VRLPPANSPIYTSDDAWIYAIIIARDLHGPVRVEWVQPDGSVAVEYPATVPNQKCWSNAFQLAQSYPPRPLGRWTFRVTPLDGGRRINEHFVIRPGITPQNTQLLPPSNLTVEPLGNDMRITWANPQGAIGFTIERNSPTSDYQQIAYGGITNPQYHDHLPLPNIRYCYRLRAFNVSYSQYTEPVCAIYLEPPRLVEPPEDAIATTAASSFVWSAAPGADTYQIEVHQSNSNREVAAATTSSLTSTVALQPGSYCWSVQAKATMPVGASVPTPCRRLSVVVPSGAGPPTMQ
jgi:hypothetical protein